MTLVELPEGIQHGTPEGFAAGCHKDTGCPALHTHGMACVYAHVRSTTDVRYYKAKVRNPEPAAIAAALGIKPPGLRDVEKDAAVDEAFDERHGGHRGKPRNSPEAEAPVTAHGMDVPNRGYMPRHIVIAYEEATQALTTPDAAQPLAERAHDTDPQEGAGAPAIETETPAAVTPTVEAEAMGHPTTTTPNPTKETPTVPTPADVAKPTTKPRKKPNPTALTTDKWTAGLTIREKTAKLGEIRAWARTHGFPGVPTHGKIPQDALAAYDKAHPLDGEPVVTALKPRPVPGGIIPALLRKEAEASVALDTGDHDGQTFTVDGPLTEPVEERMPGAEVSVGDVVVTVVDEDGVMPTFTAPHTTDAPDETPEPVDATPDPPAPLEPVEFSEALEQARDRSELAELAEDGVCKQCHRENHPGCTGRLHGPMGGPRCNCDCPAARFLRTQGVYDEPTMMRGALRRLEQPTAEIVDIRDHRPEWADVTISEDVERARSLAIRLEAELARAEAERDTALAAVDTAVYRWWAQVEENNRLRAQLAAAELALQVVKAMKYAIAGLRRRENRKARR